MRTQTGRAGVVAVLAIVIAACGSGDSGSRTGGEGASPLPDVVPVDGRSLTEPLFLVPGPDGPEVVIASSGVDGPDDEVERGTVVVLGAPVDGGVDDVVVVGVGDPDPVPFEGNEESTAIEVNGWAGWLSETSWQTSVSLTAGDRMLLVWGGPDRADVLLEVAEAVDPAATQAESLLTDIPEGLVVIDQQDYVEAPSTVGIGGWFLLLDIGDASASLNTTLTSGEALSPAFAAGLGGGPIAPVAVRGSTGLTSSRSITMEADPSDRPDAVELTSTSVVWVERPGMLMTLQGSADLDTLVALADGLVEASRQEFEQHGFPALPPVTPTRPPAD